MGEDNIPATPTLLQLAPSSAVVLTDIYIINSPLPQGNIQPNPIINLNNPERFEHATINNNNNILIKEFQVLLNRQILEDCILCKEC